MNKKLSDNYLERVPERVHSIGWSINSNLIVTLEIHNTGIFNKIAQKLFKKPEISYIHLDEIGSYIWPLIDGEKSIMIIGKIVERRFDDKIQPLYERLSKYMQILESYNFITWK